MSLFSLAILTGISGFWETYDFMVQELEINPIILYLLLFFILYLS